ncbi:hypothetical protein BX600DRAFT_513704 [Xylariales sp. PMI_506]|nr:hypothetical protein BX600DRAFT_513704 [Xylariales sp. PMI_506]
MRRIVSWIAAAAFAAVAILPRTVSADDYPTNVCATTAPPQTALKLTNTVIDVGPRPWGLAWLNSNVAFAAVNFSISVMNMSTLNPSVMFTVDMPAEAPFMGNTDINADGYGYRELTLSHNKLTLYVATGYGAIMFDVVKLVAGSNDSYAGVLSSNGYAGQGAIQLTLTPDDQHVFVSQEFGSENTYNLGAIEVYSVARQTNGTIVSDWRGFIALGYATIAQAYTSDYKTMFVTSEVAIGSTSNETVGTISVLDVATLMYTPGKSLIGKLTAGCHPTRAQMSTDGNYLWVAQRDANVVFGYDAAMLAANQTDAALVATANTGTSPIGMAAVGNYILTTDSNRFSYMNTTTGVTVINTKGAQTRGVTNFPQIPSGNFSRSLAVSPSGDRLLVSEFNDGTVRVIDVAILSL